MTNEEIAERIINQNEKALIPQLWERVKLLLFKKATAVYYYNKDRFSALGIELSDIEQECYFVLLDALRAYHEPYKFVTYLEFPFKKMLEKLMKKNENPFTECIDEIKNSDGFTLKEILMDENENLIPIIDAKTDSEIIREEVDKLPFKQKTVIRKYYFNNMSDREIAGYFQCSIPSIFQLRKRALENLRKSSALKNIYYPSCIYYGKGGFLSPENYHLKYIIQHS